MGADPLGKHLRWPTGGRDLTVVGVVGGVRDIDLEAGPRPVMFLPYEQVPWRAMALVLRPVDGTRHAALLAASVRRLERPPRGHFGYWRVRRRSFSAAGYPCVVITGTIAVKWLVGYGRNHRLE